MELVCFYSQMCLEFIGIHLVECNEIYFSKIKNFHVQMSFFNIQKVYRYFGYAFLEEILAIYTWFDPCLAPHSNVSKSI